jgi:hypothetical protein
VLCAGVKGTYICVQLLPSSYLDLVLGADWRARFPEAANGGVRVGQRVEVDLGLLGDDTVIVALVDYQRRCREIARNLADNTPIGAWVIAEQLRVDVVQQAGTKSAQRGDLNAQFDALSLEPESAAVVAALLGPQVDFARLAELGVTVERDGDVKTVATLRVEGARSWDTALGGGSGANEIERHITLSANHAAWRDRQVRRLTRVEVRTLELLADPAASRELLAINGSNSSVNQGASALSEQERNTNDPINAQGRIEQEV